MANTRWFAIDIETRANPSLDRPELWAEKADKLEAPGNYKDPAKILDWKTAQAMKMREQAALFPWSGIIVSVATAEVTPSAMMHDPFVTMAKEFTEEGERDLLACLTEQIFQEGCGFVTWNGRDFDLPFLLGRGAITGISQPWVPKPRDYRMHLDLFDVLGGKLADWCPALGIRQPEGDVLQLSRADLMEKNRADVRALQRIALSMSHLLPRTHQ